MKKVDFRTEYGGKFAKKSNNEFIKSQNYYVMKEIEEKIQRLKRVRSGPWEIFGNANLVMTILIIW